MITKKFPDYKQVDSMDCGPTCLRIIGKHYGKVLSSSDLRDKVETTRLGSTLFGISSAAEKIGFKTLGAKLSFKKLSEDALLPCILHWNEDHFVVLYKIKKDKLFISDPEGIALLAEPLPEFYSYNSDEDVPKKRSFGFLFQYLKRYKQFISQLIIGLIAGSFLQLMVPFLTQGIVDIGIKNQDINFIYLILIGQILIFIGRLSLDLIRGWILLHLSTRINISIVSDFFIKLMKLPISYFDVRLTGDILQRISDHERIERLLTTDSLSAIFSFFNLFILGLVLAIYNLNIFLVFALGSILYVLWILFFLKRRKKLDYKRFAVASEEQSKVIEIINGMQEIKLHNAEQKKRWGWEFLQVRLYRVAMKTLALEQTQSAGSSFINEFKNALITVFSATLVVQGQITLGMMLAIQYIIGQLNNPLNQLLGFIQNTQDAKISLERLNEIHEKENEEDEKLDRVKEFSTNEDITLKDLSFRYISNPDYLFDGLSLTIPANKTTAIVGTSGSGKTTLLKLLMKFYEPSSGEIRLGPQHLKNISIPSWRDNFGVVMQDGYIFNDTIANNICVGEDVIDRAKLIEAARVANIKSFIEQLPKSYNTKIGNEGVGLSMGQKQRILIARAVYKDPAFLFFDEATSALDANNEKIIIKNLEEFFLDRTVIIIAHRLSTVKNADQIVVLDEGQIVEQGNHAELTHKKGAYYHLVKNQLELGN